ncbi:hypothetical protein [Azotobacter salinestris]|uniref:hypothetical protein n=1 Tax=Azotobacter salinestris TaxID=69964 RepID=UPI0032DF28B3
MTAVPFVSKKIMLLIIAAAILLFVIVFLGDLIILIENRGDKRVLVRRVELDGLPISWSGFVLEPQGSIGLSAYKMSGFPELLVVLVDERGVQQHASCRLDVVGSDLCRIIILSDGGLNCSECYK